MAVLKSPRNVSNKNRWVRGYTLKVSSSLYNLGTLKYKRLQIYTVSSSKIIPQSLMFPRPLSLFAQLTLSNPSLTILQMFQFSKYGFSSFYCVRFYSIVNLNSFLK